MNDSGAAAFDPNAPAVAFAAAGATVIAALLLGRSIDLRRRAGGLVAGTAPTLDIPPIDAALVVLGAWLFGGLCGGFWFHAFAIAGVAFLLKRRGISPRARWGGGTLPPGALLGGSFLAAVVLFFPLQFLAGGIEALFHRLGWPTPPEPSVALFLSAHGWRAALTIFAALVLAPVGEEILFRGFLQPILRRRLSPRAAIGVTALLFAGLHGYGVGLPPLLLFGAALGLVYETTGSLLLCMGIHFWFNSFTAALLLLGGDNP